MSGGEFYEKLYNAAKAAPTVPFKFDIKDYVSDSWDENKTQNDYTPEVKKLIEKNETK